MPPERTRQSKADPGDPAWARWLAGVAIIFLSAFVAVFPLMAGEAGLPLLVAIMAIGGVLAGLVVPPRGSPGGVIATLTLPLPIVACFVILSVAGGDPGFSQTDVILIALGLFAIFEIPIAATAGARALVRRRAWAGAPALAGLALDDELAAATDYGRADTVVREYPDTRWGRAEVRSDRHRLAGWGYVLVELEERAGTPNSYARLAFFIDLPGLEPRGPSVVATFKRGDRPQATDAPRLPETPDAPSRRRGRRPRRRGPSSPG